MTVKYFAYFRKYSGSKQESVNGYEDLRSLLLSLSQKYGKTMENNLLSADKSDISDEVIILINGRNILHLNGLKTKLNEADEVCIFPRIAGG